MKSRSHHRIPTSDPNPEDWVNGSWTVDCVCGVNFDDGEEMVNCDECGIWVHTRCSRYVKSEKSFACDKCKMSKKNIRNNDSKETEVAQLLIELPATTLRMDNLHPPQTTGLPRRRSKLWTDIPIQERVHVQGIPGGEPTLFSAGGAGSLSSVFTRQLWKSTGYVPKKFNFQYREFPCWDEEEKEVTAKTEEENENPIDKGAGVLFSLSKKNVMEATMVISDGMKRQVDNGGFDRLSLPSKEIKKGEGDSVDGRCQQNGIKKNRTLLQPFVVDSGKRKKEDSGTFKDRIGKNKVRVVYRGRDSKKRAPQASKTASTLSSDARQLEFCEERGPKIVKTHSQTIKNADLRVAVVKVPLQGDHVVENNAAKRNENLSLRAEPSEELISDMSGHKFPHEARSVEQKTDELSGKSDSSYRTDDDRASLLEKNDAGRVPLKEEVGLCLDNAIENGGSRVSSGFDPHKTNPLVQDAPTAVAEGEDGHNPQRLSSLAPGAEVKTEAELDNSNGAFNIDSFTVSDVKPGGTKHSSQHFVASADLSATVKTSDTAMASSQFSNHKMKNCDSITETTKNYEPDSSDKFASNLCQPDQSVEEVEVSIATGKRSLELKHDSRSADEPSKVSNTLVIPQAPYSGRELAALSVSSSIMISKHSVLDNCTTSNAQNHNPIFKRGISQRMKKDSRGEERHEMPMKMWKDGSKTCASSVLKASHSSNILHASDCKTILSDSNDALHYASSKASSAENIGISSGSGEPSSSLQSQSGSHLQNKVLASVLPQRGEKVNLLNSQLSTKVPVHPPGSSSSTALLSDEELALLLHQELNSSPRVPRVPRMRHTGSLPQIGSPTPSSTFMKRASNSVVRDHNVFTRRKAKDLPKRELIDDETKVDRLPPSHDSSYTADAVTKRESDSVLGKGVHTVKKSAPTTVSTATVSSGPSSSNEANEQNVSSTCNSQQSSSDDAIKSPDHHTLPGLVAEIMSKGKRMTYEELCSAVLPHWPNLRKHNGDRYAYSSHSHAVLDCLRNRHEWAQLVDRGPKTNAGRKKRKLDVEAPSFDPEDNEYGKDTTGKDVDNKSFEPHPEEFPKGKRKARKRRQLALRGRRRSMKDGRKADDDADSFSSCSEVSVLGDDEVEGGGSEACASSDERS